jgi:hypothetical protein
MVASVEMVEGVENVKSLPVLGLGLSKQTVDSASSPLELRFGYGSHLVTWSNSRASACP